MKKVYTIRKENEKLKKKKEKKTVAKKYVEKLKFHIEIQ